jgi:hypothetical protein
LTLPPSEEPEPLHEIDLSSALEFMARHHVGRMNLTLEAVDLREEDLRPAETQVGILEHPRSFTDFETPSEYGLAGVFVVYTLGENDE